MALDLGNLINIVAGGYATYQNNRNNGYSYANLVATGQTANGYGEPGAAPTADCHTGKMLWDPNANCGVGKWVRRSRKKRKRLATQGDLKDLAALKGVLGGGEAFKVWIATHS